MMRISPLQARPAGSDFDDGDDNVYNFDGNDNDFDNEDST